MACTVAEESRKAPLNSTLLADTSRPGGRFASSTISSVADGEEEGRISRRKKAMLSKMQKAEEWRMWNGRMAGVR